MKRGFLFYVWIGVLFFYIGAVLKPCRAADWAPTTYGLHTVSQHAPGKAYQNNDNWGAYAIWDNCTTVGGYRNTLNRTTLYAGCTLQYKWARLLVGAATGYQKKTEQVAPDKSADDCGNGYPPPCTANRGFSRGAVTLLAAPGIVLPPVWGAAARVSYVPKLGGHSSVIHLSIEWSVK